MSDQKLRLAIDQVADMLAALETVLSEHSSQAQVAQEFDDKGWEEAWRKSLATPSPSGRNSP